MRRVGRRVRVKRSDPRPAEKYHSEQDRVAGRQTQRRDEDPGNRRRQSRKQARVEAVRNALFRSARHSDFKHFGNGILQANAALAVAPQLNLPKTPPDDDSFAFFRVITGLGIAEPPPRERMFNLELAQRYLMSRELQDAVPDPARGLLVYPGRGGGSGSRMPRKPRPLPMAGAGAVPVPMEQVKMGLAEPLPPMFSDVG